MTTTDWTWKQAVAEEVMTIVNHSNSADFSLEDLYARADVFQRRFPNNRHVREKIRQTLQRLRAMGLVHFLGGGRYELNLAFDDLDVGFEENAAKDARVPKTIQVVRNVRLRNTLLATDLKRRYEHVCQICESVIQLVARRYAEAHHIRPLGAPHCGPDIEGNILVVCPNHHVMLDHGAISLNAESLMVSHIHAAFEPRPLYLAEWHRLDAYSLRYYGETIYGRA